MSSSGNIGTPTIHFHIPHWLDNLYRLDFFVFKPKQQSNNVVKIWLDVKNKRENEISSLNLYTLGTCFNANGTFHVELKEGLSNSVATRKFIFHYIDQEGYNQNYYLLQEMKEGNVEKSYFFQGRGRKDSLYFPTFLDIKKQERLNWIFSIAILSFSLFVPNITLTSRRILWIVGISFGFFAKIKRTELKKSALVAASSAIVGMLDGVLYNRWERGDREIENKDGYTFISSVLAHKQNFEKEYENI